MLCLDERKVVGIIPFFTNTTFSLVRVARRLECPCPHVEKFMIGVIFADDKRPVLSVFRVMMYLVLRVKRVSHNLLCSQSVFSGMASINVNSDIRFCAHVISFPPFQYSAGAG